MFLPEPAMRPTAEGLLARLVGCPSVNPVEGPVDDTHGEARMANLLGELLGSWGAEVELVEVRPGRPNVLARFRGADEGRSLMLEAHSDTVPVAGMTVPPFGGRVEDGRFYGRGACDDKGPLAAMLLGIRRFLDG